ncbi:protein of unknown function [Beijerinckiaceae bacterium RH AL1]|nr:MarR family winged helix-turn-helix transcriptional regulator [Beijerinckiaceae bacterium]VVB48907.1 protein of unknown function [Beijerinckiaceae bacterium RH CH11]VVB48985.1 protein of unknown function [Beijerinckiaceae bacterium RH AL8]VVC56629.1 protein of unknown function [Beijerinckiaceae bacterium RH AL1]
MSAKPHAALEIGGRDIREVSGCSCLRLRKAARKATQLYEESLKPAAVTIGQFGVLANLFGSAAMGEAGCAMGMLADRVGVDPTTLKRTLAPLLASGLVATCAGPDRRIRLVRLTDAGRAKLDIAVPLWAAAQARLEAALGDAARRDLDRVVAAAYDKMTGAPPSVAT